MEAVRLERVVGAADADAVGLWIRGERMAPNVRLGRLVESWLRRGLATRTLKFRRDFRIQDGLPVLENNGILRRVSPCKVVFMRLRCHLRAAQPHKDYFERLQKDYFAATAIISLNHNLLFDNNLVFLRNRPGSEDKPLHRSRVCLTAKYS